ncbi:hypothetical protein MCOR25_000349 [Pyricularia grisea]|nr:hypothetical protein MCOR25_000349 [Pyricularia grisea]
MLGGSCTPANRLPRPAIAPGTSSGGPFWPLSGIIRKANILFTVHPSREEQGRGL